MASEAVIEIKGLNQHKGSPDAKTFNADCVATQHPGSFDDRYEQSLIKPSAPLISGNQEHRDYKTSSALSAPKDLWTSRSSLQSFAPNLFITNFFGAKSFEKLRDAGISHILVCANELPTVFVGKFVYCKLVGFTDNTHTILEPFLWQARQFIAAALAEGGRVLVHCASGSSRSGAIAVGYLALEHRLSINEALAILQKVRPIVQPNPGFIEQLNALEISKD